MSKVQQMNQAVQHDKYANYESQHGIPPLYLEPAKAFHVLERDTHNSLPIQPY
jgi:hypothetical protein